MKLQSWREVDVTREKLRSLEERYKEILDRPCENEYVRELTLQSYKSTINQLKEEIAVFESHTIPAPTCNP